MMKNTEKTLFVITGPTAIGKTALSIELAKTLQTQIISADSRQFYKELKIGTAPPSIEELKEVKHHFIGHLSIHDYYNASKYESDAIALIEKLFNNCNELVMVGGSGLYINSVLFGIDEFPDADQATRDFLKDILVNKGIKALRKMLEDMDPEYYNQVDLHNPSRIMRALEVCMTTGVKFSSLRKNAKKPRNFNHKIIGLKSNREDIYEKINRRTDLMIKQGLIEEARELMPYRHLNALNTVGYKEIFEYLDGNISRESAIADIKTNTRRYAKRQLTWFLKQEGIKWFHPLEWARIIRHIDSRDSFFECH